MGWRNLEFLSLEPGSSRYSSSRNSSSVWREAAQALFPPLEQQRPVGGWVGWSRPAAGGQAVPNPPVWPGRSQPCPCPFPVILLVWDQVSSVGSSH